VEIESRQMTSFSQKVNKKYIAPSYFNLKINPLKLAPKNGAKVGL
jgi:hypothetical protein